MTKFKDLNDKVNRLYLDLREAERQRDENLAKVLALQATVRELEAKLTASDALAMTLLNEKADHNLDEFISELEKAAKELENDKEFQEELANDIKLAKDLEELEVLRKRVKELEGLKVGCVVGVSASVSWLYLGIPYDEKTYRPNPKTLGEATTPCPS